MAIPWFCKDTTRKLLRRKGMEVNLIVENLQPAVDEVFHVHG